MQILITRSEPGASRMAAQLKRAGLSVVVQPLIDASSTHQPLPDGCFDHVIFVSEHAVAFGADALEALGSEVQWYAIGPATGESLTRLIEASAFAAQPRVTVPKDARSEGLLRESGLQSLAGQSVLLVAGEDGRSLIADTLRQRGAQVTPWLVYRRVELTPMWSAEAHAGADASSPDRMRPEQIGACIASSGQGLELLTRQWFAAGGGVDVPVCVPSPRIAKMAAELGWQMPILCAGASAEATLDGLAAQGVLDGLLMSATKRNTTQ